MNTKNLTHAQSSPMRIAHYRIVRKIGQGGMSIVYEGIDEKLRRAVAIKVLHPFLAESVEYRSRFFREAYAVARLTHPNIVQIFDVSSSDENAEQLYIVTELLSGDTLKDVAAKINFVKMPELAALVISSIAHALHHAHNKDIIHRDIKPENIMIGIDGHIKLTDFGIASVGSEESITQSGTLLGSLAHLSPEVIKGHKATIASDIFSLSTVLYWMFSQSLPFVGVSPHALLKAIVDNEPVPIRDRSPYLSDDLAEVVERGMHDDPSKRYGSALAMAEAIEHALARFGVAVDMKQVEAALIDPARALTLNDNIVQQIRKQHENYLQQKNDALALALNCRLEAQPRLHPPSRTKIGVRKIIFVAGCALSLITIGIVVTLQFFDGNDDLIDEPIDKLSESIASLENLVQQKEEVTAPPPVAEMPETKVAIDPQQIVEIIIWPFADVMLNGKTIARAAKSVSLKLNRGTHRLSFTHPYAATLEKTVKIEETTAPVRLNIALNKSKPAFLVVKANVDGDVAVDGSYKGSAKKSLQQPIVIPMPDRSHAQYKEIIVTRDDFMPFIIKTEFIAGATKEINVTLEPQAEKK